MPTQAAARQRMMGRSWTSLGRPAFNTTVALVLGMWRFQELGKGYCYLVPLSENPTTFVLLSPVFTARHCAETQ